jgi:hypothetical protein
MITDWRQKWCRKHLFGAILTQNGTFAKTGSGQALLRKFEKRDDFCRSNHTDGATDVDFPFGWAQLNSDGKKRITRESQGAISAPLQRKHYFV